MSTASYDTVWKHHGIMPHIIVSDRDSKFKSGFWHTPWNLADTQPSMSTAYSPQTDGAVERVNRVLEEMLRSDVNSKTMDWPEHVTACEYAYNDAVNKTTGFSPFKPDTWRDPVWYVHSHWTTLRRGIVELSKLFKISWSTKTRPEAGKECSTLQSLHRRERKNTMTQTYALLLLVDCSTFRCHKHQQKGDSVWLSTWRGTDHTRAYHISGYAWDEWLITKQNWTFQSNSKGQ